MRRLEANHLLEYKPFSIATDEAKNSRLGCKMGKQTIQVAIWKLRRGRMLDPDGWKRHVTSNS